MSAEPVSAKLIPQLRAVSSASPRVLRIQERITGLLNAGDPINMQHHLKALWHRDRIGKVISGDHLDVMPTTVEFVPSLDCNYNCPTCTYLTWKQRTIADIGKRQMSYDVMMTLLDKIEEADVKGVIVTGGGEPFKNPDTVRGIEYAAGKKFHVGLFSNGSLLDGPSINRLAGSGLRFMRVSFNSGDPQNYQLIHGLPDQSMFFAARRNIQLLANAFAGTDTGFGLGVIVNGKNVEYMHTVAEVAREILTENGNAQLRYIAYRPIVNYGQISPDRTNQISRDVVTRARDNFERVKEILRGFPVTPIFAGDYFDTLCNAKADSSTTPSTCMGKSWGASISYDGGVYLCSERDGNPDYLIGNLIKQSFREIWASEQRRQVIARPTKCPPMCKMHRTNDALAILQSEGPLDAAEAQEVQSFLDIIRAAGDPGGTSFI